ncbi:MAG: VacJ family lipoprotein [Desulfovibrionaceae bacterium]|nr:VacJ family lipoprotein [Desulfovibrionaceae bacterium]MBF0514938.1 VacJ family lipoprotein [Desulfovibrionaceae bacterium]
MNPIGPRARALLLAVSLICAGAPAALAGQASQTAAESSGSAAGAVYAQADRICPALADDDAYGPPPAPIADPLEGYNRAMFRFNDAFYFNVLKPVSHGYGLVVPRPLRIGIKNAYDNLLFPVRFINSLLQFKPGKAANELGRFMLNTVFGVGGLFDVAKERPGLKPMEADFGQTLGVWGFGQGFYFVIPFLGPSSLRDGLGRVGDLAFSPVTYATEPFTPVAWYWSWAARIGDGVNNASLSQGEYEAFKNAAVEPYAAMRDGYAQYRRQLVGAGSPCPPPGK